ncbi:MAG: hypothetical protein PHI32_13025 [Dysgonamonadaceae bacterium]|nr:hypothetical protein [Dysgonamonadaceae bacterium]
MKKTICLFILCTVLLVSCNNNSKPYTTNTDNKIEINCTNGFFDMDVDNHGRIYVCDKEVIRVIDPKNNTEFTFKGTLKFGRLVTVGDNRVCVFDEKDSSIKVYDYKGNDVSEYSINADYVHGITYIEHSCNEVI